MAPWRSCSTTWRGAPVKRPGLFKLADTLHDGGSAIEKKIADLEKATEKTGHNVSARSALEVMQGLKFQPAKILSVYRDYLRQDAAKEGLSAEERKAQMAMANKANRAVLDTMEQKGEGKHVLRLSAGERKEIVPGASHFMAHAIASPSWRNAYQVATIGDHTFLQVQKLKPRRT